jgi:nitroreductase
VIEGEARHRLGETIARIFRADCPDAPEDKLAAERARLARAPLVVAVVSKAGPHPKIPEWEQVLSTGAVCMNLVTAANALGFGTAWITEWIAYDRRFLDALGLTHDERLAGYIHIGRPAMVPSERPRPDLAQIVTRA